MVLRADRVIGNTCQYTPNCIDWSNWLIEIGGKNTNALFVVVKNNYLQRRITEANVEAFLREISGEKFTQKIEEYSQKNTSINIVDYDENSQEFKIELLNDIV